MRDRDPETENSGIGLRRSAGAFLLAVAAATAAVAQPPTFSKAFTPGTIGLGSTTELRFDIVNASASPLSDLAFTDVLPAGMTIATPASAVSDCLGPTGILSAPDGGNTISLNSGRVGAASSCSVAVNVIGSAVGALSNVSGDLTSSAGNSGPASADLTVATDRPGFSKSFAPGSIPPGGTSVLTFTIDNTAKGTRTDLLAFTDVLPAGLVVATPANAASSCNDFFTGEVTATPGSSTISHSFGSVAASSTCAVTVDVTAAEPGTYVNTSFELEAGSPSLASGFATALLDVPIQFLNKSFTDDPAVPGGDVTLEFHIQNPSRSEPAAAISFTDDLGAALSGLAATGLPVSDVCGAGSQLSGTGVVALVGGSLPPGGNCTFSATLAVPPGAASGSYVNTTSALVATIGGEVVVGNTATDTLVVNTAPLLTKAFIDDPAVPGGQVTLRFTILNTDSGASATAITFTDPLPGELVSASSVPPDGFCGAGSTASFTPATSFQPPTITVSGASLGPGASCFFDFVLGISASAAAGSHLNITSTVSALVGGSPVEGLPASDSLVIVGAPILTKLFTDDPVAPGDTVNLEFTLIHGAEAPGDATSIAFTDDLNATLAGLVAATPLPVADVCGAGSQLGGTASNLSFTGGTLPPGGSCSFTVTLQVPAAAPAGSFLNTTSDVTATVSGLAVSGSPGSDSLEVAGLVLTKEFTDDPALPGDEVTLQFTLENLSPVSSASGISFSDDLDATLSGLAAIALPPGTVCNGGTVTGTDLLIFSDGNLGSGASCQFKVTLEVPLGAEAGLYANRTSQVSATFGGAEVTVEGGTDGLEVLAALSLAKSFLDDPADPGGSVTLQFTLENLSSAATITSIAFTDDLEAVLPGLEASALPDPGGACNGTITGTGLLTFNGGSLDPLQSCSFSVTLEVPTDVGASRFTNTTSAVTGSLGGFPTSGDPATDDLELAVCFAPDGENLTLQDDTVLAAELYEVCDTIFVGPNFTVSGPNGFLDLRAGVAVIFGNATTFDVDSRLVAGLVSIP